MFCVGFIYVIMLVARLVVTDRDVLGGLAVVLEDDGDVHVDDDEEADHEVGQQEGDRHDRVAAVALVTRLWIRCNKKYFYLKKIFGTLPLETGNTQIISTISYSQFAKHY